MGYRELIAPNKYVIIPYMYKGKNKSTIRQTAYARRVWGAQGTSKKEIALDCGYSKNVSNSVVSHIEVKPGFHSAMAVLANESNNVAVSILHEFKRRGVKDFSDKNLIGALNAIGSAWSKFNPEARKGLGEGSSNKLRTVILQQVENQTINNPAQEEGTIQSIQPEIVEGEIDEQDDQFDF